MNEEALFNSGANVCPLNAKVRVFLEIFALCLSAGCFLMKELKSRGVTKSKLRCFLTLHALNSFQAPGLIHPWFSDVFKGDRKNQCH